ncbi:enoyl-CoA hydratase/isomerase family protein [Thauera phenolivorans]|uniref:enoyl-CoA hydratase/isomerase family protein n=1 Tax=Thauera phenolivorans TaxID=1792543 RepID=UPI00083A813C|nr:enoyl-CoA hydratase/isomerase family protein [Thauera phenolivorans]
MSDCVILREFSTACGRRFGHATLNAPASLNALSLEMIDRLAPRLDAWAADPGIVGVVLDGAGDKAFCAGGDVRSLHRAIRAAHEAGETVAPPPVRAFFEHEYRLDYRIHTYPKPLLCWGHGIVMGGGLGLMAGASHRVVTPQTRIAMPEIAIGLYPDVGGSWFLRRMPGHGGLFLALTGAAIGAADARFAGLADFVLAHEDKSAVLAALADSRWRGEAEDDRIRLGALLEARTLRAGVPPSTLRRHFDRVEEVIAHDGLHRLAPRLRALADDPDPWLAAAGAGFAAGAPSSAVLCHAIWQRVPRLSLAEVFRLEYRLSLTGTMQPDFAEGVRALLVDKDRRPRWRHAAIDAVPADYLDRLLDACVPHPHPLADLD